MLIESLWTKNTIFEDDLDNLLKEDYSFIIAIGYKQMRVRKIFEMIKSKGQSYKLYTYDRYVMGEIKGEGNIILSNAIIEPYAKVYDNNIIWSNSLLCHDSIVGSHFIAASSVIWIFESFKIIILLGLIQ